MYCRIHGEPAPCSFCAGNHAIIAQEMFEAITSSTPKIDNRTPKQVQADKANGWPPR